MCHYAHLTPFEREKIFFFLAEGKSIAEIAHLMKRKNIVASSSYRPHRRASCQCSEPFRLWPLGSGYCGEQARKGMPRHAGVPEAPVLACWKSHEQDRRCRQPPHHPWERGIMKTPMAFYGSSSRKARTSRIRQRITSNGSTMS